MAQPTREELDKAIAGVRFKLESVTACGPNGIEGVLAPNTRKSIVDAIMALSEDKPTPKWEEEFEQELSEQCRKSAAMFTVVFQEEIKDFIRNILRECAADYINARLSHVVELNKKYGL